MQTNDSYVAPTSANPVVTYIRHKPILIGGKPWVDVYFRQRFQRDYTLLNAYEIHPSVAEAAINMRRDFKLADSVRIEVTMMFGEAVAQVKYRQPKAQGQRCYSVTVNVNMKSGRIEYR